MIPLGLASAIGWRGAAAIGLGVLAGVLWLQLQWAQASATRAKAQAAEQTERADRLSRQLTDSIADTQLAESANRALRTALEAQHARIEGLMAEAEAQAQAAQERIEAAERARRAAVAASDRERRARPDVPPAAEMSAILRDAFEAAR